MTDDRWSLVERLFGDVLEVPEDKRSHWLLTACGEDLALRQEVESLLVHHEKPQPVLAESALGSYAQLEPEALLSGQHDPWLGKRVGAYRLDELLGAGGMGSVYRATRQDGLVQHTVAIKLVRHSSPDFLRRFQAECQTLAKMSHANIARLLDTGVTLEGTPFLVMEYVNGTPIDCYCDANKASVSERLELVQTVTRAVHYAHQNLVVHRDLKPANVLVTEEGVPKLLDFGIAKALDETGDGDPTVTEARLLTPNYASPEQLRGDSVTTAADVYSLGVVLYELLTGSRPCRPPTDVGAGEQGGATPRKPSNIVLGAAEAGSGAASAATELVAGLRQTTASRLRRRLRGDLDNIVLMALREDPQRRYLSALQFSEDLERHAKGLTVVARPDAIAYRVRKFLRRNRVSVLATVLVIISLGIGTVATAWQAHVARSERDASKLAERRATEEADHARIEASSAQQMTEILSRAFLASGVGKNKRERESLHVLLAAQVGRVRRQFATRPHLRANLIDALGRVFLSTHAVDRAATLIGEAADIRETAFGVQSLEFAQSLNSKGELAYRRGEFAVAERHFRGALHLHEILPAGVHTDVPRMANNLGVVLRKLGKVEEAVELHQRALTLRRTSLGDDHLDVAESLNNLSAIHLARAEYEQAEVRIEEALEIRRAALGEQDPLVAQTLSNLASAKAAMGHYEQGSALFREAIASYRNQADPDRLALARTLGNLVEALLAQGQLEEARGPAEEALALTREVLDPQHPRLASALRVSAKLADAQGEHDAATLYGDEAIAILRHVYGDRHIKLAMALGDMGVRQLNRQRASEAESSLRQAVAVFRDSLDPGHPHRVNFELSLGICLLRLKQYDEAESLLVSSLARLAKGSRSRKTARTYLAQLRKERSVSSAGRDR